MVPNIPSDSSNPNQQDLKRIELIQSLVRDCRDGYCTIRIYLENSTGKVSECPYAGNCRGEGWCDNRARVYDSTADPYILTQFKEIEKVKYIDSLRRQEEESWQDAVDHWINPSNGGAVIFREAFNNFGIRDIGELEKVCVHAIEDAHPIKKSST